MGGTGKYSDAILREDAIKLCEAAGLIPVFKEEAKPAYLPGEVWSQDIAAGTETTQGTKITLRYVKSATTTVPDGLIGKTELEVNTAYGSILRFAFIEGDTYDPTVINVVTAQSITTGTTVAMGTTVTLTLG